MGKRKLLVIGLLWRRMVFGLAFLGIKGIEWYQKYEEHHVPGRTFNVRRHYSETIRKFTSIPRIAQIYFSLYFAMTGLHALHMIIGVGIFVFLTYYAWKGSYTPEYYTPIEIGGLYWHFVDIVWIYLFPLVVFDRSKAAKVSTPCLSTSFRARCTTLSGSR